MATDTKSCDAAYAKMSPYTPPSWAQHLKVKPGHRFRLRMSPTPIHQWSPPGVPREFQVSVKREDLTGSILSGNKVRKLEFLLADAVQQGCDSVVTFGGPQSNHTRCTAVAAREIGLQTHIMVMSIDGQEPLETSCSGNALLSKLSGAKFVVFPTKEDFFANVAYIHERMKEYTEKLNAEGHKTYYIPAGGSSTVGVWGYIDGFAEMISQGVLDDFDDIIAPFGSGGTISGLAIANYLTGSRLKVHAVSIVPSMPVADMYKHIDETLDNLGLTGVRAEDIVDPVMEYGGIGYDVSSDEELESVVEVASSTGIALDLDFGVKAYRGMVGEMNKNPGRFAGKRVLFIQTGGIYNLFDGRIDHVVRAKPVTNQVYKSSDIFPSSS